MTIVDDFEKQLQARVAELQPAVDEYNEMKRLLDAIRGERAPAPTSRPQRKRAPRSHGGTSGRRRTAQAEQLVRERPGITVADLAETMGIGTSYLYKVLPELERDGKIRKVGRGYEPAA